MRRLWTIPVGVVPMSDENGLDTAPPLGEAGRAPDRDSSGRFVRGNKVALVVGQHSRSFWNAQEAARRDIVEAVIGDAGHTPDDAPRALLLAADGIAQAMLLRDAAFLRLVESGGPMTSAGRTRRAFVVWQSAVDRRERHLRLVGLKRAPKPAPSLQDYLRANLEAEAARERQLHDHDHADEHDE